MSFLAIIGINFGALFCPIYRMWVFSVLTVLCLLLKGGSSAHLDTKSMYCFRKHQWRVFHLSSPHLFRPFPQAAMCYVHVAALVAEYLWRKGETGGGQSGDHGLQTTK